MGCWKRGEMGPWRGPDAMEETGCPMAPSEVPRHQQSVAGARKALADDVAFDRAWQEGRALALEQAIELALKDPSEQ